MGWALAKLSISTDGLLCGVGCGFFAEEGQLVLHGSELTAALEFVAQEERETGPHGPPGQVPEDGGKHGVVDLAAREDGAGVLGAPPADGHEGDGDVDRGEDGEN